MKPVRLAACAAVLPLVPLAACHHRPAPPPAMRTPQAQAAPPASRDPVAVLDGWSRAVSARDWALARAYWGHDGADSGLSPEAFAARWSVLRAPVVIVGGGREEGAAGSLYYEVPVTIVDGARRIAGHVTLRRVNDVPGASAEDLRWHVTRSDLQP